MGEACIRKNKLGIMNDSSMEMKLIYFYRYFSFVLTSLFYIAASQGLFTPYKPMVVICLAVAAVILNNIYIRFSSSKTLASIMIVIETLSNIIILIPTGGLSSPYLWYSLNTVLISAYLLSIRHFYLVLMSYITSLVALVYIIFNKAEKNFLTFLLDNSNLLLSFILITFAVQILMKMTKKLAHESKNLTKKNQELVEANYMIKESIQHITTLYQTMNDFMNIRNKERLVQIITSYARDMTQTDLAFVCIPGEHGDILETSKQVNDNLRVKLLEDIRKNREKGIVSSEPFSFMIDNIEYTAVHVKTSLKTYGVIGIEALHDRRQIIEKESTRQLKMLAFLSALIYERFENEEINKRFIISEEQNRIANEIHDSVSQRLFFTSSKVHSLIRKSGTHGLSELNCELLLVKDALKKAMKELREAIYSYSEKNNELSLFEVNIKDYLSEISKLNDIDISYSISGNQELVDYQFKKIIFRILCEGIGNAINHGRSKNINVNLIIDSFGFKLRIEDDGVGFDLKDKISEKSTGLGIKNLHYLTHSNGGEILIDSRMNGGTRIHIEIPFIHTSRGSNWEVV